MTCRPRVRYFADGHADAYCTRHALATSGHPDAATALATLSERHRVPQPLYLGAPPAQLRREPARRPLPAPPGPGIDRGTIGKIIVIILTVIIGLALIYTLATDPASWPDSEIPGWLDRLPSWDDR